jgi:hypothetical protein
MSSVQSMHGQSRMEIQNPDLKRNEHAGMRIWIVLRLESDHTEFIDVPLQLGACGMVVEHLRHWLHTRHCMGLGHATDMDT